MKILIGLSYYYPNISGLSIYAKNLAESLVEKGFEVKILTSRHNNKLKPKEVINGVKINRVWTPFLFGRGPIMPLYPLVSFKEAYNADVINIHIPQFEGFLLAIWGKSLGKKIIITHHCDLSDWPGLINQIGEKVTLISLLIAGFLADKIVVYTRDYAQNSTYLQRFKNKLVYILPPIKIVKPLGFIKNKWRGVDYKIGFAGRIAKEKGIGYLIKAIPLLREGLENNFKIFLAGPSEEVVGGGYKKNLQSLIKKYSKYLVFLGSLNAKEMSDFYRLINILILPSTERIESFGYVQVEAMLSGCPVVASNLPGVRVPIRLTGMGETVKIKNSEILGQTIVKILKNKDNYIKTKKEIGKIFDYKKSIEAYEEIFG